MPEKKPVYRGFSAIALAAAIVGCLSIGTARQAEAGAVDQGREIARQYCARCHAIDPQADDSADGAKNGAGNASPHVEAPPFREIATKYPLESLEEAFAEGIVVGHRDMPEFELEPEEITALLSFMASVGKQ